MKRHNWVWAVRRMLKGKAVRREEWPEGCVMWIEYDPGPRLYELIGGRKRLGDLVGGDLTEVDWVKAKLPNLE